MAGPDSLHRSTEGKLIDYKANFGTEIDPGPWGQTREVTFAVGNPDQRTAKVTLIRGEVNITPESGEPVLRNYTISMAPKFKQPPGPRSGDEDADVHVVASISYGIGGAQQIVEISVKRGTQFTLPASFWDISCYIEPIPDMDGDPGDMYPDDADGPKTVQVFCSGALGSRSGAVLTPTRDVFIRSPGPDPFPVETFLDIPASAGTFFMAADPSVILGDYTATYIGRGAVTLQQVDLTVGVRNPVPPGATAIRLTAAPAVGDGLLIGSWEIFLLWARTSVVVCLW